MVVYSTWSATKIEKLLQNTKWYIQGGESKPLYILVPYYSAIFSMQQKVKLHYGLIGGFIRHSYTTIYYDEEDMFRNAKTLLRRYLNNKTYFSSLYKLWHKELAQFYQFIDDINNKDYSELSNKDLLDLFNSMYKKFVSVWDYFILIDFFDPCSHDIVAKILKDHKIDLNPDELKTLVIPDEPSFITVEHLQFLEIAQFALKHKKNKDELIKKLENHQQQFYWYQNNYGHVTYLTVNDFAKKLNDALKEKNLKQIEREIVDIKKNISEHKKERKKLLEKLALPKEVQNILQLFADLAQYRDERKKMNLTGITALRYILYKISKRLNIDVGTLEYFAPWEIPNVFRLSRKELLEVRDRKEGCLWIFASKKDVLIFKMQEALKWKNYFDELLKKEHHVLKGMGASKGHVTGKVKVITLVKEFYKMEEGDILVTQMTRPEFTPIIPLAAAIVTDEGGITSHAAIVSRELGKPCIIGTQIATSLLKDGMYVEVDADHGKVIILKK